MARPAPSTTDAFTTATRRPGRPRSFDRPTALRQAMLAFWKSGYEGTSISDLTAAMGINAPSLYGAFGDKQRLFVEVLALYTGDSVAMDEAIRTAPSIRDWVRGMLRGAAKLYTGANTPKGCLLASAAASGSAESVDVRNAVAAVRRRLERSLEARLRRDVAAKLLPSGADPAALSAFAVAMLQGLSVLARDGAKRQALLAVVETAMLAWPRDD